MPDANSELPAPAEEIARLKAELDAIKAWQARILLAFDHLQSGLVMYGPDDVLLFCNRRFREIYPEIGDILVPGTPYSEIARAFYRREFASRTPLSEEEYVSARVKQHLWPDESDNEYQMGEDSWVMASDRKTADGGVIGFRLDISERKLAERRLAEAESRITAELERKVEERTRDLSEANGHLEADLRELRGAQQQLVQSEKLASLGFLVAGVAHEINTPIGNALLMGTALLDEADIFAQLIKERPTRGAFDKHIAYTKEAGSVLVSNLQRAGKLVQGFKQLALDRATEQRRQFVLRNVIDEVLLAMGPILKHSAYAIAVAVPPEIVLDSYPGPLTQILVNFINNAIVHGFEGRDRGRMSLSARLRGDGQVALLFEDDGCGMPAHVVEHVFDPFFTTKLGQGGNGLGMHIAYNIATQLLGGSIEVDSAPGQGARWHLVLPIAAP